MNDRIVRWGVLVVLVYGLLLPTHAPAAAPAATSSVPAGLSAADWHAIQAQLPHAPPQHCLNNTPTSKPPTCPTVGGFHHHIGGEIVTVGRN